MILLQKRQNTTLYHGYEIELVGIFPKIITGPMWGGGLFDSRSAWFYFFACFILLPTDRFQASIVPWKFSLKKRPLQRNFMEIWTPDLKAK